jgi:hypothetical protein
MKCFSVQLGIIFSLFLLITFNSNAQITYADSLSIQLEATVVSSPASITLTWPADGHASNFKIYRKLKTGATWTLLTTTTNTATQYIDATAIANVLYDYKIYMTPALGLGKFGYLSSGINVIANSNRGIAIVVIENSFISNAVFQTAINLLLTDLENDGWFPKAVYVNKTDAVTSVKSQIVLKYNEDVTNTKLLLLVGNIPVPYSGFNNPDGHTDHRGAWPTDAYYADINGAWTDASVNDVTSSNSKNHNIPGDGKYDQDQIPSLVELQVGRIDLSNLPITTKTEEQLLLNYLNKLHRFKTKQIIVQERALIDEGDFTTMTEGFAQNGFINFSGLVGRTNIVVNDYFTQLSYNTSTSGTYLWSFGCGGGTYTGSNGIGTSSNFATDSLSSVFTMLFGSYYGDWDNQNAFLRMPLTQGNTLTNAWAGRPNWHFYHMAMGENIGYSEKLTQNNSSLYQTNSVYGFFPQVKSINLMGDPSLRNSYILAPTNLNIVAGGVTNALSWTGVPLVDGYNIYRRYSTSTVFVKLNTSLVTATTYTDNTMPTGGTVYYYVKSVKKKISPSGSFDNESLGIKSSAALVTVGVTENNSDLSFAISPNPSNGIFNIVTTQAFYNYDICDNLGRIIFTGTSSQFDINSYANGIYYVKIKLKNEVVIKKIIKNN